MPDLTPEQIEQLQADHERLKEQLQAERHRGDIEARRADTLDGRVRNADRQLAATAVQTLQAQEAQAASAIAAADQEIASLEEHHTSLLEEGKFREASAVQTKMATAAARKLQAEQSQSYFRQQREQVAAQPTDPVERFLRANPDTFSEVAQAWIRRNPRFATDQAFAERVKQAHQKAIEDGVPAEGETYFKRLEAAGYMRRDAFTLDNDLPADRGQQQRQTRERADDAGDGGDSPYSDAADDQGGQQPVYQQQQRQPQRGAAAAPPSRRTPSAPAPRRVVANLTPDQADMALRNADLAPESVRQGGDAAILQWWHELNSGPTAQRIRESWSANAV